MEGTKPLETGFTVAGQTADWSKTWNYFKDLYPWYEWYEFDRKDDTRYHMTHKYELAPGRPSQIYEIGFKLADDQGFSEVCMKVAAMNNSPHDSVWYSLIVWIQCGFFRTKRKQTRKTETIDTLREENERRLRGVKTFGVEDNRPTPQVKSAWIRPGPTTESESAKRRLNSLERAKRFVEENFPKITTSSLQALGRAARIWRREETYVSWERGNWEWRLLSV